ncbi:DNAJ heat shock N-terminal domain-containing protein [Heracleum sosnowskyi]|uniref:DNAJ heat shock N-terminal domain-containing protein n=1 Tax=Heracleum sosnowskyi TaxID=360622 RepID=A0AAD8GWU3_9APIA|nr:DNAJ heat shock N-terminal domain-containing protein [Heracleum sosnowskyi]
MNTRVAFCVIFLVFFVLLVDSKKVDPYKVLGVDKSASQREIQKAFHKLSLQYHPDKNKNKGAQEKFAEINNAYDILSDEEKRKNYDLYGDERANPGFGGGPNDQGHTYFTSGGPGQGDFNFRPDGWQSMGDQGGSKSFSFSFGGPSSGGFGLDDIFSNFFGGNMGSGSQFGGSQFGGSHFGSSGSSSRPESRPSRSIPSVNTQMYRKEVAGKGMTWLLLSSISSLQDIQYYEPVVQEVDGSLQGAIKVGKINCDTEASLCKELGIFPRRTSREHLPRFSKRVNLDQFKFPSGDEESLPTVILLSTKKDTPVIWRALSGLYQKKFLLYDAQVHDTSNPLVKKLGVDSLPALVGWTSKGEKHILKTGISVKDLKSAVHELSDLLDGFEKKNKKAGSTNRKQQTESEDKQIPMLTRSNFDSVCGENIPVCIIGVFKSSKTRTKLESILLEVSHKSLSRRQYSASGAKDTIAYALLDATKQSSFLNSFDKYGYKSSDSLLLAYKPRKDKFAAFVGDISMEEVEKFIGSVLNGDVQFTKTRQKPKLK